MRKLTLSLIAGAAAVAAVGVAYAQPAPAPQQLTRAAVEQRVAQVFDRLDANHDGKLDQGDRAARQKARFDHVDANHDGEVSYAEFTAARAQLDGARAERGGRFGRSGVQRMAARGFQGRPGLIRLADTDKDGAITKAEFQAAALARFDRLDTNKDGTVTRDEAKAARDNLRQQWQAHRQDRAS
ncbi:MAG: EF-hand domain-containing protein [Porphyrobacter sp.]|nr:EF-hand domain-containing protein [Porphyrobacter sp.]